MQSILAMPPCRAWLQFEIFSFSSFLTPVTFQTQESFWAVKALILLLKCLRKWPVTTLLTSNQSLGQNSWDFYPSTSHVDSFYASNPQLVSISSSPVPMYCITCTCIFYAFSGALCLALFWRKPTQGSFCCLNIHIVSCTSCPSYCTVYWVVWCGQYCNVMFVCLFVYFFNFFWRIQISKL